MKDVDFTPSCAKKAGNRQRVLSVASTVISNDTASTKQSKDTHVAIDSQLMCGSTMSEMCSCGQEKHVRPDILRSKGLRSASPRRKRVASSKTGTTSSAGIGSNRHLSVDDERPSNTNVLKKERSRKQISKPILVDRSSLRNLYGNEWIKECEENELMVVQKEAAVTSDNVRTSSKSRPLLEVRQDVMPSSPNRLERTRSFHKQQSEGHLHGCTTPTQQQQQPCSTRSSPLRMSKMLSLRSIMNPSLSPSGGLMIHRRSPVAGHLKLRKLYINLEDEMTQSTGGSSDGCCDNAILRKYCDDVSDEFDPTEVEEQ